MAKVRLDDVAVEARETWNQDRKDVPVVGLEHLEPDEIWLRQWNVNPDENTFTKGFKKGQLLFGRRRAYQKKMSLAPCDGICSGDITVIAAKPEKIVPELLPFYLRTGAFFDFAMRGSGGSLSPRVKWSHISDYEFDLPPMDEQKKLAELLWAANDLKESYKKAITATDEMIKAKFREMFGECGGQGAEGDRRVSKWPLVRIAEVVTDVRYGTSKPGDKDGVYAYLRMNNLTDDGGLDLTDLKRITLSGEDFEKCVVRRGDILFNRTNTKELVGKTAYYDLDDDMVIAGYIIRIRVDGDKIDPRYLWKLMNTVELKTKLRHMAKGAIHQANINAQELQSIEIPFPPLSLQREFVAIADKAESAKANLKKSIAAIDQVMKGLINQ